MLFALVISVILAGLLSLLVHRQITRLRKSGNSVPWVWVSIGAVLVAGAGFWMNQVELLLSSHMRIIGLPLPMVFFHLEDGEWIDFIVPFPWVNFSSNIIIFGLAGAVAMASVLGRGKNP